MSVPFRRTTTAALLRAAAVVGVLAGGTFAAGAATAGGVNAAETICVALVVDFADLGAGVDSDCVKVPDGSSGEDVLRAQHTLGFRPNQPGFVCTIDGWPHEGCSASNGDHYWAYFHRAPGSSTWTYSTAGASGYEPRNNSTEGWVWLTRKDQTPADVAFSSICKPSPSPSPKPTTSSPSAGGGGGGGTGGGRTRTETQKTAPSPASSAPTGAAAPSPSASKHRSPSAGTPTPSASFEVGLTLDGSPAGPVTAAEPRRHGSGYGPPYGLLAGVVVVGGIGAAAVVRSRRNRGEP